MYLEGLFIVIAIVIGIFDFAAKQQKKQGGSNRQGRQRMQSPVQRQNNIPESLRKVFMDMENSFGEVMGGAVENKPEPVVIPDEEGIELEDRKKLGSLEYIEQSESLEGTCDEHPEHGRFIGNQKKAAPRSGIAASKEDLLPELTEDNLIRGIVLAEILGPPRAYKRRIR
jgi:hypothetical protein